MMKKYILYIIITILLMIIASGVTYAVMKNKDENNDVIKENNNELKCDNICNENNDEIINDVIINEFKTENEKLKEALEGYLDYVPTGYDGDPDKNYKTAYQEEFVTIDTINKSYLLYNALRLAYNKYEDYYIYKPNLDVTENYPVYNGIMEEEKLDNLLKRAYNLNLNYFNLVSSYTNYVAEGINGICYYYFDNVFADIECSSGSGLLHNILDYQINKNEMVIYTNTVSTFFDRIYDEHTGKEYILTEDNNNSWDDIAKNYIQNHTSEFTKFKHTFKKNDTGYYWYSTEVVD